MYAGYTISNQVSHLTHKLT